MNEIVKPAEFDPKASEYLAFHWKAKTSMGYDRTSVLKYLHGDEEALARIEACGWLDENGVEIFMARWFKFVDSSRAMKYLYDKARAGFDILSVNSARIPGLYWTYLQNLGPGVEVMVGIDVECYCTGKTCKDLKDFVIDEYIFVGRTHG